MERFIVGVKGAGIIPFVVHCDAKKIEALLGLSEHTMVYMRPTTDYELMRYTSKVKFTLPEDLGEMLRYVDKKVEDYKPAFYTSMSSARKLAKTFEQLGKAAKNIKL